MLHANTSSPDVYWRIPNANWRAHLEQCHRNPDTLKGPDTMLNQSRYPPHYGKVSTSASWKTARTVECFDHREKYFSPWNKDELSLVNLYKTALLFKYFVFDCVLTAWSFVVFLLWMLCVAVTKNLRSITVGIKICHKPDVWHQWTHSTFRKIISNFKTKNINKL